MRVRERRRRRPRLDPAAEPAGHHSRPPPAERERIRAAAGPAPAHTRDPEADHHRHRRRTVDVLGLQRDPSDANPSAQAARPGAPLLRDHGLPRRHRPRRERVSSTSQELLDCAFPSCYLAVRKSYGDQDRGRHRGPARPVRVAAATQHLSGLGEVLRCGCHTNGSRRASMTSSVLISIRFTYGKVARRKRAVQQFLRSGTYAFPAGAVAPWQSMISEQRSSRSSGLRRRVRVRGISLQPEYVDCAAAVTMMIRFRISGVRRWRSRSSSNPFTFGRRRSRMMTRGLRRRIESRPSAPSFAHSHSSPSRSTMCLSSRWIGMSSSMTSTSTERAAMTEKRPSVLASAAKIKRMSLRVTRYALRVTRYALRVTYRGADTHHASRITHHASRVTRNALHLRFFSVALHRHGV